MKAAEGCLGALGSFFLRFFLPSAASPPSSAWAALGLLGALGVLTAPSPAGLGVLGALGFGFGFGCWHTLPQALRLRIGISSTQACAQLPWMLETRFARAAIVMFTPRRSLGLRLAKPVMV